MPAKKKMPAKKTPPKKTPATTKTAAKPKAAATKSAVVGKPAPAKTRKAASKTAPETAAAKKTAPKTAAAKKTDAKEGSDTVSDQAGTDTGSEGKAPQKSTSKPKVPFAVGDKVVYPHHGAATIIKRERIDFGGERHDYFVLEVATDQLTVRVPALRAVDLGVRPVISRNMARKVFATFKDDPQEAGANWSRWYKLLTEKINSGDIFQVAEVVRDLTYAQQVKGISPALKRMLAKARLIIISELRFALDLEEEDAIRRLDRALPKVDEPVEV